MGQQGSLGFSLDILKHNLVSVVLLFSLLMFILIEMDKQTRQTVFSGKHADRFSMVTLHNTR